MASQINIKPHQVPSSVTQVHKLKSLRSLDEGKTNVVTVRVSRKWEELDFVSTNDVTSVDMVIVDEEGKAHNDESVEGRMRTADQNPTEGNVSLSTGNWRRIWNSRKRRFHTWGVINSMLVSSGK